MKVYELKELLEECGQDQDVFITSSYNINEQDLTINTYKNVFSVDDYFSHDLPQRVRKYDQFLDIDDSEIVILIHDE